MAGFSHRFKVVMLGDADVGKTSLLRQYVDGRMDGGNQTSVGVDFKTKTVDVDGEQIRLQLWDTAGQERYHKPLSRIYYRGAQGVIVTYDISRQETFAAIKRWLEETDRYIKAGRAIRVLVGNKCDLHSQRAVEYDEAKEFADQLGLLYVETSAKTAKNVEAVFLSMTIAIKDLLDGNFTGSFDDITKKVSNNVEKSVFTKTAGDITEEIEDKTRDDNGDGKLISPDAESQNGIPSASEATAELDAALEDAALSRKLDVLDYDEDGDAGVPGRGEFQRDYHAVSRFQFENENGSDGTHEDREEEEEEVEEEDCSIGVGVASENLGSLEEARKMSQGTDEMEEDDKFASVSDAESDMSDGIANPNFKGDFSAGAVRYRDDDLVSPTLRQRMMGDRDAEVTEVFPVELPKVRRRPRPDVDEESDRSSSLSIVRLGREEPVPRSHFCTCC